MPVASTGSEEPENVESHTVQGAHSVVQPPFEGAEGESGTTTADGIERVHGYYRPAPPA